MLHMTPTMRALRTFIQVVLAEAAAIPGVVAGLGVDAATTAKVGAVCGAVVVIVSTGWNAVEHATGKTLGAVPSVSTPPGAPAVPAPPGPPQRSNP